MLLQDATANNTPSQDSAVAVGFKRYSQDGRDIEEITCVNPTSVKVKYAHGTLVDMQQYPEDAPAAGEGLALPVEQVTDGE